MNAKSRCVISSSINIFQLNSSSSLSISIIMRSILVSIFVLVFFVFDYKNGCTTAMDPVYLRSNSFGQLVTSNTLRWVNPREDDRHPVKLDNGQIICRITRSGKERIL